LEEAYESLAEALLQAAEMLREPPRSVHLFETQAHLLSAAFHAALTRYAQAEIPLLVAMPMSRPCSHRLALSYLIEINDRVGHCIRSGAAIDHAADYLRRGAHGFHLARLLEAMRRQTSRATWNRMARATKAGTKKSSKAMKEPPEPSLINSPPAAAFAAYRLSILTGRKQTEIAEALSKEWHQSIAQGTVSRWIRQVEKFLKKTNILPNANPSARSRIQKPLAMDPAHIDLGPRRDGRSRQRRSRRRPAED
jgi:hypothetical protein